MALVHSRYKFLRRFLRRDSGFTLTELVIAMVVLAVIASIAIPSFLGSRNNSYDKEAQTSIEVVLRASKFLYQSQGDFSDASSAQCGDSTGLAADLQKLEPNVDVVASSVSSTNSRIVSVQAVQTWDSTGGLLGCQGFYAVAFSSSGSCWAARIILEGKYLASGNASPVVVNAQTNTSNNAVTTWSALAVNGHAFGVLKPQTSAADGDNTNNLLAIKTACKAKNQSTGSADVSSYYIAPSQFYTSWRDTVAAPIQPEPSCANGRGTCVVGDTGPGGGKVFYVQAGGGTFTSTGSDCGTSCKYLEAAPSDQSTGVVWATGVQFCYHATVVGLDFCNSQSIYPQPASNQAASRTAATPVGMGMANTNQIYSRLTAAGSVSTSNYAAGVAWAYSNGDKTDWHLPSRDELNQMCKWNRGVAWTSDATVCTGGTLNSATYGASASGFSNNRYWSSSEVDNAAVWHQLFTDGTQYSNYNKGNTLYVRPIRAFG
jgi:prepilin-type N-terminal cleavage/methylation domain-containing protein